MPFPLSCQMAYRSPLSRGVRVFGFGPEPHGSYHFKVLTITVTAWIHFPYMKCQCMLAKYLQLEN